MDRIPVAFYARVSSEEQAKGESVDHQFAYLQETLERMNDERYYTNETLWYKDEGVSGYSTMLKDRDDLQRLLMDAREGKFGMILVKHSSRIARDGEEITKVPNILERYKIRVRILMDGYDSDIPHTKFLLPISGLMNQKFSEDLSVSVSVGNRAKAKQGKWAAILAPIGYKINKETKKLEVDESTAMIPKLIFDMYVNKRLGTQVICETINNMGYRTRKGYKFDKSRILAMIKNRAYIGDTIYGKTRNTLVRDYDGNQNLSSKTRKNVKREDPIIVEKTHLALIDEIIFWKAQEILASKAHNKNAKTKAKYPLIGIIKCAACGSGMVCQKRVERNYRYYKCNAQYRFGTSACDQKGIRAKQLEKFLHEHLLHKIQAFCSNMDISYVGAVEKDSIKDKIKQFEAKKRNLINQQANMTIDRDLYTDEAYREIMSQLKQKIEQAQQQINVLNKQLFEIQRQDVNRVHLQDILEKLEHVDLDDIASLRALFHELIEVIVVRDNDTIESIKYKYDF